MSTWLMWCIDFCGKLVAKKGQNVQARNEALEKLMLEAKVLDIEHVLKTRVEATDDKSTDDNVDDSPNVHDVLTFLTKVCYRKAVGVIGDAEFQFFKSYIEWALGNETVRSWIVDYHWQRKLGVEASPYRELLNYGVRACVTGGPNLCEQIESNINACSTNEKLSELIRVSDNRTYGTHLAVLNGIFNKGLLFHMNGGSPLDERTNIWFPHIYKNNEVPVDKLWYNTLSDDGRELREHCTDAAKRFGGVVQQPKILRRYAFARFMDKKDVQYKFIGIFEFVCSESASDNEICWLYKRTSDVFEVASVRCH